MTGDAARRDDPTSTESAIAFRTAVRVWFAVSLQTFGGPAGRIAVMQRTLGVCTLLGLAGGLVGLSGH